MKAILYTTGSTAGVAINERIDHAWRRHHGVPLAHRARLGIALATLAGCMLVAQRFGLVALIAKGYRALAVIFLLVYVIPLLTLGLFRLRHRAAVRQGVS